MSHFPGGPVGPDEDRLDLSPLDPLQDSARFESRLRSIRGAVSGELARRRLEQSVWGVLLRWKRPLLTTCVAAVVLCLFLLIRVQPDGTAPQQRSFAETIGVPTVLVPWIAADGDPTLDDLFASGADR